MTLFQKIHEMSLEELAKFLVYPGFEQDFDYQFDGEDEYPVDLYNDGFVTSDKQFFFFEDSAIEHQIELLQSEYSEQE